MTPITTSSRQAPRSTPSGNTTAFQRAYRLIFTATTAPTSGACTRRKSTSNSTPTFPTNDKLPPAVDVYRQALAKADDRSVTLVAIGPLRKYWALYDSKPDAVSPLAGPDLIKQKVRKFVIMANTLKGDGPYLAKWPTSDSMDDRDRLLSSVAARACSLSPTPMRPSSLTNTMEIRP